jgi:serine/threonine-protein kinase PknK
VTAERLYQEAVALARGVAGQHSHAARLAGALLGRLRYERGETDTAERLLEECHELGAESGVADFMIATYSTLARIKALRGDIEDAWSLSMKATKRRTNSHCPGCRRPSTTSACGCT